MSVPPDRVFELPFVPGEPRGSEGRLRAALDLLNRFASEWVVVVTSDITLTDVLHVPNNVHIRLAYGAVMYDLDGNVLAPAHWSGPTMTTSGTYGFTTQVTYGTLSPTTVSKVSITSTSAVC